MLIYVPYYTLQIFLLSIHLGNNHNSTSENKNYDEKCGKCNRNCRTKAVECRNGHWVHYNCEKLRRSSASVNLCALLYSSDLFAIARVFFNFYRL
jgi:hypothetical protein